MPCWVEFKHPRCAKSFRSDANRSRPRGLRWQVKPHGGARFASAACAAVGTRHHDTAPTKSATATASGGESPVADSIFITGYQLGCQADVSSGLGLGMGGSGAGVGNAGVGAPVINPVAASDSVGVPAAGRVSSRPPSSLGSSWKCRWRVWPLTLTRLTGDAGSRKQPYRGRRVWG